MAPCHLGKEAQVGVDTALCGPTQGGSGQRPVLQGQHTALQAWGYSKDSPVVPGRVSCPGCRGEERHGGCVRAG